jgi:chaperonin GroEL (HSP60 family)
VVDRSASQNDDERVGIEIVRKAVQTPLRQIAENAGEDGAVISGATGTSTTRALTRRPASSRTW